MTAQTSILLPRPTHLSAFGVTLYNKGKLSALEMDANFLAILGANGLGKSTLLNLLIYAITGIVRKPDGPVDAIPGPRGFLNQGQEHASSYFEGRVAKQTKEPAYVDVTFVLGEHEVKVRRRFFHSDSTMAIVVDGRSRTPKNHSEMEAAYRELICELSRTATYEQFVFLVYTLQYFGEDHYCLFWNPLALNQIVSLVVSGDADEGQKLTERIQEFKKHDSHFRNLQWQITTERRVLKAAISTATEDTLPKGALDRYADSQERIDQLRSRLVELAEELSSATAARDECQTGCDNARRAMDLHTLSALSQRRLPISKSPLLQQFSADKLCPACRTPHTTLPEAVTRAIGHETCPLCQAAVTARAPTASFDDKVKELRALQKKALAALEKAGEHLEESQRLYDETQSLYLKEQGTLAKLEASYRKEVLDAGLRLRNEGSSQSKISQIEQKISALMASKEEHKEKRATASAALTVAQKRLLTGFQRVRGEVVPTFQKLARQFLGMFLNLSARQRREDQVPIVDFHISVENAERRRAEQLSESQRYFVDIALRMTLLSWLSKGQWSPFLAIDTPEGSLDIAYEMNAGEMFGGFLTDYGGVLLTASNLNSSQLIRKTLEVCHKASRTVILKDLREWGVTTQVQVDHKPTMDAQIEDLRRIITRDGALSATPSAATKKK